jgi:hypothetical protein
MDPYEFPAPRASWKPRAVRYGAAQAQGLLARTAAGESLRAICRDPTMPAPHTVHRWLRERPGFAAAMLAARQAAGGPFRGGRCTYCRETAEAIFARLCAGESITRICKDPDMPVVATVYKWRRDVGEFDEMLRMARDIQADGLFDRGGEICEAATPETAYLAKLTVVIRRFTDAPLSADEERLVRDERRG